MTKWTPNLSVKSDEAIHIKAEDKSNVAQMTLLTRTGRRNADEVLATAHLFAAAPELYEALDRCQGLLAFFDNHASLHNWHDRCQHEIKEARAVMAKARGE